MLSDQFRQVYQCVKCGDLCALGTLSRHKCSVPNRNRNIERRKKKLAALIATGRPLRVTFYGLPPKPRAPAAVYSYRGTFTIEGDRVRHSDMQLKGNAYTRHISKIKSMEVL